MESHSGVIRSVLQVPVFAGRWLSGRRPSMAAAAAAEPRTADGVQAADGPLPQVTPSSQLDV